MGQKNSRISLPHTEDLPPTHDYVPVYKVLYNTEDIHYGDIKIIQDYNTNKKMILKEIVLNTKEAVQKEIEYFAQRGYIPNSNLVQIAGYVVEEDKRMCSNFFKAKLFIEYIPQDLEGELQERIETKRPFTDSTLLLIADSLISSLAALQMRGIAHGDIRPLNIFSSSETYKLFDPLLSPHRAQNGLTRAILNREGILLAPELVQLVPNSDFTIASNMFKADVYSLGMTLLSLATLLSSHEVYNYKEGYIDLKYVRDRLQKVKTNYSTFTYELIRYMLTTDELYRPDFNDLHAKIAPYQENIRQRTSIFYGGGTLGSSARSSLIETELGSSTGRSIDLSKQVDDLIKMGAPEHHIHKTQGGIKKRKLRILDDKENTITGGSLGTLSTKGASLMDKDLNKTSNRGTEGIKESSLRQSQASEADSAKGRKPRKIFENPSNTNTEKVPSLRDEIDNIMEVVKMAPTDNSRRFEEVTPNNSIELAMSLKEELNQEISKPEESVKNDEMIIQQGSTLPYREGQLKNSPSGDYFFAHLKPISEMTGHHTPKSNYPQDAPRAFEIDWEELERQNVLGNMDQSRFNFESSSFDEKDAQPGNVDSSQHILPKSFEEPKYQYQHQYNPESINFAFTSTDAPKVTESANDADAFLIAQFDEIRKEDSKKTESETVPEYFGFLAKEEPKVEVSQNQNNLAFYENSDIYKNFRTPFDNLEDEQLMTVPKVETIETVKQEESTPLSEKTFPSNIPEASSQPRLSAVESVKTPRSYTNSQFPNIENFGFEGLSGRVAISREGSEPSSPIGLSQVYPTDMFASDLRSRIMASDNSISRGLEYIGRTPSDISRKDFQYPSENPNSYFKSALQPQNPDFMNRSQSSNKENYLESYKPASTQEKVGGGSSAENELKEMNDIINKALDRTNKVLSLHGSQVNTKPYTYSLEPLSALNVKQANSEVLKSSNYFDNFVNFGTTSSANNENSENVAVPSNVPTSSYSVYEPFRYSQTNFATSNMGDIYTSSRF